MTDKIKKILNNNVLFFTILTLVSAFLIYILNKQLIDVYMLNDYVGGWDGSGHFAIGKYYAENIFPSVWGWVPSWYNGMPFPQFYPPLFYYVTSLIHKITSIEYQQVFKYFLLSTALVAPLITSLLYFYRIKKSKLQTLFVMMLSVFFISAKSKLGFVGISLSSLLNNGLATQPIAFIFLILWLIFFLNIEKNKMSKYYASFFLFLLFLSNAHVVLVAFLFFVVIFLFKFFEIKNKSLKNKEVWNKFFLYFFSGFIPLLIASFWYIPMLYYYNFSTSTALGFYWGSVSSIFIKHYYILIIMIISIFIYKKIKNILPKALIILTLLVMILEWLKINTLLPNLPIHIDRWFGTIYFIYPVLIVYTIQKIREVIKSKYAYRILILIIIISSAYNLVLTGGLSDDLRGIYLDSKFSKVEPILDYFKDKEGLILVETHNQYSAPADKVLNAYLGAQGNQTIYTIIRESAISAIFYTPIRNSLSYEVECWGINCFLSFNREYLGKPFEEHLRVATDYGIEYFLIRSAQKKEDFDLTEKVEKVAEFNEWAVYRTTDSKNILIPQKEPLLVFSGIDTKRERVDFGFINLVENINIRLGRTDFTFVHSGKDLIEDLDDLNNFNNLILSEYYYENFDLAAEKIIRYSENSKVIAFYPNEEGSLLYNLLEVLSSENKNIIMANDFVDRYEDLSNIVKGETIYRPDRKDNYEKFIDVLDEIIQENTAEAGNKYNVSSGQNYTNIYTLSDEINPVIINQSYFPAWKSIKNNNIYLASPSNTMIFIDKNDSIYFETTKIVIVGHLLSLFGILLIIGFIYRERF